MREMIREAGWPIYLVLAFGAPSLLMALRYALGGTRDELRWAVGAAAATLLCGLLGTVLGVERSIEFIRQVEESQRLTVFLIGLRESLHNTTVGLGLGAADAALVVLGLYRHAAPQT
jgi:hypothetical protein